MRAILTNLSVFVVLTITLSSFSGCKWTASNVSTSNSTNSAGSTNSADPTTTNRSSQYPMLAAGLADADFELLDGTKTKVSAHKGKVVMLNLWGIWCGPCRQEMPHLVAMQQQYADKGFEVIGLNIGDNNGGAESVDAIKKFSEQMKLNYTLARIDGSVTRQFYLITKQEVVPQSMIIDREGHLRGVFVGGGQRIFDSMQEVLDKTMAE